MTGVVFEHPEREFGVAQHRCGDVVVILDVVVALVDAIEHVDDFERREKERQLVQAREALVVPPLARPIQRVIVVRAEKAPQIAPLIVAERTLIERNRFTLSNDRAQRDAALDRNVAQIGER